MAGAWLGVPLLSWRMQCPLRLCAALAAGLGGWGRVLCLSRSPLPAPCSVRCVWRVVPSGCPLPSPAVTPFHAVCAFRGLGLVAILVFPACPLRVCALALSRRPRPSSLPGSVWRAHLTWFRCRAPVGPFHAVRAPPRFLPRSRAPSGLLWGGGGLVPFPPCLALGRVPTCGRACASGAVRRWGGRPVCRSPRGRVWGAPGGGGRSTSVLPSASPGRAPRPHRRRSVHAGRGLHTAPVRVRVPTRAVVRGAPLCAGAVRLPVVVTAGAGGWQRGGVRRTGLAAFPLQADAALFGGGGGLPWPSGGTGSALPWPASSIPRAGGGGVGGRGGGVAPWFLVTPLQFPGLDPRRLRGMACSPRPRPRSWPAAWHRVYLPTACSVGAVLQPRAPGAVWRAADRSAWWGEGGAVRAPPLRWRLGR